MGAGCAGLSLLMRMIQAKAFADKKILLLDRQPKTSNDRTWCFWETKNGFFDEIVYKKWDMLSFFGDNFSSIMPIAPYQYKMIRGVDFYNYSFKEISHHNNIEVIVAEIGEWQREKSGATIFLNGQEYSLGNPVIFNSIYKPADNESGSIRLLQHFKGWVIESDKSVFEPQKATMMDFRMHQDYGTTFVYVLPFNERTALVEYTLFTKELLPANKYDEEIRNYVETFLDIGNYRIKEEEFGVIPMTNRKFSFGGEAWNIGTAGGQTKASSGYTFQFIQKQSQQIVDCLLKGKPLDTISQTPARFRFYDNTLLDILYHDTIPGKSIFTRLFKKNKPQQVLRFLDNESSFIGELKIISSLPTWPFLKAALRQL
ncbi:MAG TPA: lycopene cyclase family protein [Chitinophagaceae bacterium]|nr:lycopene cyclase family protein [Chitinophagaceae bacterium]